jgi:hypothetical protein
MYETGGEVKRAFWVMLAMLVIFLIYAFWPAIQFTHLRLIQFIAFVASAAFWWGIGYGIYRLCRRK